MKKGQVDIITMGCSKNLVDSEKLMTLFEQAGYHCTHDAKRIEGEIVVINTCGFIEDAKQESIDTILELVQAKEEGKISKLFVMGCLSQRYQKELEEEIPQVDKYYGKFNFKQLLTDLGKPEEPTCSGARHITTPHHYAYIKISEGCDRRCAYCAIPIITGKHVSRPKEEILEEVRELVANGVKEFQIIAQELTYYGVDIDGKRHIADLISDIADIKGVKWIRLHYAYPNQFPFELLDVIREKPNVCKYLDIALQHISDNMLTRMHRHVTKAETMEFIERIRKEVPGLHLRTTLLVGFPGETEEDFLETMDVVRKVRYDSAFTFQYSRRTGTPAAAMEDQISVDVVKDRFDRLLAEVQEISREVTARHTHTVQEVLVESINEQDPSLVTGRMSNNTLVHFKGDASLIGTLQNVYLDECRGFYYMGTPVENS